jgi:MFS family permease
VGISLGCIFGGDFIKNGRRATIIQFNIIGLLGSIIAMFLNFWQMCFGRCIYGFATGVIMCTTPKMLAETIPPYLMDKGFGMSTSVLVNIALFLVLLIAGGMPDDTTELGKTNYWMIVFGL